MAHESVIGAYPGPKPSFSMCAIGIAEGQAELSKVDRQFTNVHGYRAGQPKHHRGDDTFQAHIL